ncbi:uncharacterized protein LOC130046669 isoform X2 [Ostrea edulis]|uniref:uncharacterized protein LOC130046669 isoform X2 n=1 Tax=Ostrea edulis TaxID=37623 RepID=UPI0024AF23DB|nr:uncharacterized protein LOC130046669 isoform X2 [Ostrea edulis]
MEEVGRGGCLNQKQYDIIVRFLAHGHFPSKRDLLEAKFASQEETARPRPFRKFKSWIQRLLYRESENVLIHLPTGKVVVPKEKFVEIIIANHCDEYGGHLNAFATMKKIQKTYTFGRRNFGMSEEFVRGVVRNCPICEGFQSGNLKEGILADTNKTGKQTTVTASIPNNMEQNLESQKKKVLSSTSSGLGTEKCAQTTSSAADSTNQRGQPVDWNQTEANKNKTKVKESHPIIHSTLLSQLMTTKPSVITSTGQNVSLSLPLLHHAVSVSVFPFFSNTHLKSTESLYTSSGNTVKQIPASTQTISKASSATVSKVLGINSKLGSLMTPRAPALGYYVKVPNSSSPTGFSISFVATPLVSLNTSTLCSPSTTSMPTLTTAPLLMAKDDTAAKMTKSASEKTEAIHLQESTAHPKLSTINNQSKITDQIQSQPKIMISTSHTNVLPPIKPKNEKLNKDLQSAADNSTNSSSVLSTAAKKRKGEVKKDSSSGVKKKLKVKPEKLDNKGNSGKKQMKFASPKPVNTNVGKSNRKNGNENEEKLDKSSNELDETFKKIIVVNPEKMKKILTNRLRIPSMNINFKGQCNVTIHDKSSNVHTSYIVDERSTPADQLSTATSLLGEESISRNGGSSCVDFRGTSKKEISGSPGKCDKDILYVNKSSDAEGQQSIQQTESCPFDVNQIMNENFTGRGDRFTRDLKIHVGATIQNSDKTTAQPMLPDPGPIPCPAIWSFSEGSVVRC